MMFKSIWQEENKKYKYPQLNKDIEVDVLIIGGGITGVSTAYHLKDSNLKVCLVERNYIASGVSSKTTGKLTYLQELIYSKLSDSYSFDVAKKYYESQKDAINLVNGIIKTENINCDYVKQESYLFANKKLDVESIKKEKKLLEKMGINVLENEMPINLLNYYSISVSDTAYFHPVKYINTLAEICAKNNVLIYENTNIINFEENSKKYICFTENHKISAKKVLFACHYPFFLFPFFFPLKGHLEQSYISAISTKDAKNISGINVSKTTKSFRYHNDYLLYLTGSHNLAFNFNVKNNFANLFYDLNKMNLAPKYVWSNVDIITNDSLPYIGRLKDNIYIATGYNTWGMTNGSLAGLIISDIIKEKDNKYVNIFNPNRAMPLSSSMNVCVDIFSSAKPFIENKIIKNKPYYSKNVIFTKKNGKNVAIYIDKDNKKHIVYNKCPHLKCSLIFNEAELTWDCPCHSSRFDIDGKCIKGPSKYNIGYKENE